MKCPLLAGPARGGVALLALLAAGCLGPSPEGEGWTEVSRRSGIAVSLRQGSRPSFPEIRAECTVEAPLYEVVAVMQDVARYPEWSHNCREFSLIHLDEQGIHTLYNRTFAPMPASLVISDRDVVLRTELFILEPDRRIEARFRAVESELKRKVHGVVRMSSLEGMYRVTALDSERTLVKYRVDLDPGGSLPDWVKRFASRDLPSKTLSGLRRQVDATRGEYAETVERWTREGFEVPRAEPGSR